MEAHRTAGELRTAAGELRIAVADAADAEAAAGHTGLGEEMHRMARQKVVVVVVVVVRHRKVAEAVGCSLEAAEAGRSVPGERRTAARDGPENCIGWGEGVEVVGSSHLAEEADTVRTVDSTGRHGEEGIPPRAAAVDCIHPAEGVLGQCKHPCNRCLGLPGLTSAVGRVTLVRHDLWTVGLREKLLLGSNVVKC
jgi:hypothetical protein